MEFLLVGLLWWCRAEPVVPNGDDYFSKKQSLVEACDASIHECQKHYDNCQVVSCGDWQENTNPYIEKCIFFN